MIDGDGAYNCFPPPPPPAGPVFGLLEPAADDIDAMAACSATGIAASGAPLGILFTLAPGSPTLLGANPALPFGASPGDIISTPRRSSSPTRWSASPQI